MFLKSVGFDGSFLSSEVGNSLIKTILTNSRTQQLRNQTHKNKDILNFETFSTAMIPLLNIKIIFAEKPRQPLEREFSFGDTVRFRIDQEIIGCPEVGFFKCGMIENGLSKIA